MAIVSLRRVGSLLLVASLLLSACAAPPAPGTTKDSLPPQPPPTGVVHVIPEVGSAYSTGGSAPVNDQPYDAVFFQNYGTNPIIDTEDDHLSTFAMDVDSASYTVVRRYLMDGNLPNPDAVRVEEFVNAFKHDYAPPETGAFAIHLDGAPAPFGGENYWLLRVGLQGQVIPDAARKDATLIFVIDVSGSMSMENRLELVKRALAMLVEKLHPGDEVGIVVYGSEGRVVLEPTPATTQSTILRAIQRLDTEGATNAEEGLALGYQMAAQAARADRITRVILCSDGVANVGNTGSDSILHTIRRYSEEQEITLSTIGFGMGNYNDVLMEQLANDGDGAYYYVDTLAEAQRVLVENLTGTLQVIAKDAKVQVDFNPAMVSRYRLLGYENRNVKDDEFRDDQVDGGEVGSGHSVTALYEVKFQSDAAALDEPAATVFVRYQDADNGDVVEVKRSVTRADFQPTLDAAPASLRQDAAVAEFAEILRNSYWAQDSSLGAVYELAQQVRAVARDNAELDEFLQLVAQAEGLQDQ